MAGAGALRSTVNDMLEFLAANLGLMESGIAGALRETHRPRERFGSEDARIGLGWIVFEADDRTIR